MKPDYARLELHVPADDFTAARRSLRPRLDLALALAAIVVAVVLIVWAR